MSNQPTDRDERLKQIRERREAYTRLLVRYEYPDLPNWGDIDFLLFLLDSQAALDCRPNMIAINREHAAVLMRDKCVALAREHFDCHKGAHVNGCSLIAELESLTLDQGRAGA